MWGFRVGRAAPVAVSGHDFGRCFREKRVLWVSCRCVLLGIIVPIRSALRGNALGLAVYAILGAVAIKDTTVEMLLENNVLVSVDGIVGEKVVVNYSWFSS